MQKLPFFLFCLLLVGTQALFAQGDNCSDPFIIADPTDFCSSIAAGDNTFATPSNVPLPSCFFNATGQDLWLAFTATTTDVVVTINGNSFGLPGGTMAQPYVALYTGDCAAPTELDCNSDITFSNIVELNYSGLTPGVVYYLRVDSELAGSFQFCVKSFNGSGIVEGDCPDAVPVCDKSTFIVPSVSGPGDDPTELSDAYCFQGISAETNSTWYVWTAENSETLEFTLTPNNPADDLDFVVYELPNGPGDCSQKIVRRCMAAGDFSANSPCMGPTGLQQGAVDLDQPPGCALGADNWLQPLNQVAGKTYALVVNNFTSSGNGFQIEWFGNAEFKGPDVDFTDDSPTDTICLNSPVVFTDISTFGAGDNIENWHWNFGVDGSMDTTNLQGPHTIKYSSVGVKTVTMTIQTALGCEVTISRNFVVQECCPMTASVNLASACTGNQGNNITLNIQNASGFVHYEWSNGQTDAVGTGFGPGMHTVNVTDSTGCSYSVPFTVYLPVMADADIMPGCLGQPNASATAVTSDGHAPFTYLWSNGQTGISASNLAPGTQGLTITDANGCVDNLEFVVAPATTWDVLVAPGCPNDPGAYAIVQFNNPQSDYSFTWSDPAAGDTSIISGLQTGTYMVTVQDMQGCTEVQDFTVTTPLTFNFITSPDTAVLAATPVELWALVEGYDASFTWNDGANTLTGDTITVSPTMETVYLVMADNGVCTAVDTVLVTILEEKLEFPNVFTPDGDSKNDIFFPVITGWQMEDFKVYSRWGQLIYEGKTTGWNGKKGDQDMPSDVYVYTGVAVRLNGERKNVKGDVLLLR